MIQVLFSRLSHAAVPWEGGDVVSADVAVCSASYCGEDLVLRRVHWPRNLSADPEYYFFLRVDNQFNNNSVSGVNLRAMQAPPLKTFMLNLHIKH